MRLIKCYWIDSAAMSGWRDRERSIEWGTKDDLWVVSVGFVIAETATTLTITASVNVDQVDSPMKIPKFAIKHIETLIEDEPIPEGRPAAVRRKRRV